MMGPGAPTDPGTPMLCPRCRHPNRAQAKFCDEGGAAGQVTRASPVLPRDNTAPDIDRADRRQATVLFTDISGYTAQCARSDPEQVQALLGRFYAAMDGVVEAYGGRVFDRAGDAVMAVFGAPVAHGNDGERAVRAALEMHSAAAGLADCDGQPLRLHIGIASGEVVAAVIGAGGKSKYSVTGDTVNLAARLDALAAAGDTLIADALYRSLARVVEARSLGEQALKGLAVPVPVWQVTGLRAAAGERAPLVGRDAELARLMAALETARDSSLGLTIILRGDAGIGKSRLLEEFRARAAALGFGTAAGQVLDFGVGRGQDAVASVLRAVLGVAPIDTAADQAGDDDARRSAVRRALQCGAVAADEEVFVNDLLDVSQPRALKLVFDAMDNASRTRRGSAALTAVLQRAARTRPLLLSLEDMHWASPDVLRLSAAMATATADGALIVLLTSRVDGDPMNAVWRAGAGGGAWLSIDLAPLRLEEARQLARGLIEGSSRFVSECIARAEGNPLFLEQLLRTQSEVVSVPPTIQSLVLERVDRLAEPERSALQAAAVIGKRFSLESLRAVVGRPGVMCDALLAADLVRLDGGGFLFAHALIQEAVYASTLKSVRRELHRKAAAWFGDAAHAGHAEPVLHAEHLDRAGDPGAAQAYLAAATRENGRFRHEAALRLSERGAALAATTSNRAAACDLALLRGEVLREMGRSPDSIAAFRAAAEVATDDVQRCHAWMGVAAGNRITGAFDAAMAALDQAQPIAERLGLPLEGSKVHHLRGNLLFAQGKVATCDAEHQLALAHAVRAGSVECEALALSGLGDAQYAQGRMRSALAYFQRCVSLCAGRNWVRIEAPNRCMTGHCLWYRTGSAPPSTRRDAPVTKRTDTGWCRWRSSRRPAWRSSWPRPGAWKKPSRRATTAWCWRARRGRGATSPLCCTGSPVFAWHKGNAKRHGITWNRPSTWPARPAWASSVRRSSHAWRGRSPTRGRARRPCARARGCCAVPAWRMATSGSIATPSRRASPRMSGTPRCAMPMPSKRSSRPSRCPGPRCWWPDAAASNLLRKAETASLRCDGCGSSGPRWTPLAWAGP